MIPFATAHRKRTSWKVLIAATLIAAFAAVQVSASGEIGEHVNDLQAHLDEYNKEVLWFLEQADQVVTSYENDPAEAQPAKLVEAWEAVKFHAAIETTYVPVYAEIWQGIFGVHDAVREGKPIAEVREQQERLEQAIWQALGAVKLAAKQQSEESTTSSTEQTGGDPVSTLDEIKDNLDRVVAKYAERDTDTAISLVHSTYAERFEGVEGALIEQDAQLVEDLEKDFNVTLPQQLESGDSVQKVEAIVTDMKAKLDRAQSLLADATKNRRDVF